MRVAATKSLGFHGRAGHGKYVCALCTCGYISLHNSNATVAAAINFTALALVYHQPYPDRKSVMRKGKEERKKNNRTSIGTLYLSL